MKFILLIATVLLAFQLEANILHIDFSKISKDSKQKEQFEKIKDNVQFYNHWKASWPYEKSKDEFIQLLEEAYADFSQISSQETELDLLLGTISHYLYNLDKTNYNKNSVDHFSRVISNKPNEYRAYWFLGFHYSLSNNPEKAILNLSKAQALLPKRGPEDFWENFAFASVIANMPSHSVYAMDKVKEITKKKGYIDQQLGDHIRKQIQSVDKTKNYTKEEIWSANQGDLITFSCRPLGIKLLVDSTWGISIYDYNNGQSAVVMVPESIASQNAKKIDYTIGILMKTAGSKDKLDDYIDKFVSGYSSKSKINLSAKYENMIVYEINDKSVYQDMGGGHLYMIGIERNAPKYPGLLLENPTIMPDGKSEELNFYKAGKSHDRFEGKIFYAIMLDACEDIHEESFTVFKSFFDKQLIIE